MHTRHEKMEMKSYEELSLAQLISAVNDLKGSKQNVEIKDLKKKTLGLVENYIENVSAISALNEVYQHLNWSSNFNFLKVHRHKIIDSIFKNNVNTDPTTNKPEAINKTWQKILNNVLKKMSQLILDRKVDLQNEDTLAQYESLLSELTQKIGKDVEPYPLLPQLTKFIKLSNEDKNFANTWHLYQRHYYYDLNYMIALQNLHAFEETESVLEPLQYIRAIAMKQKLEEPAANNDKILLHNAYHRISYKLKKATSLSELTQFVSFLQQDPFGFIKLDHIKKDLENQLKKLDASTTLEKFMANLPKKSLPDLPVSNQRTP